MKSLLIGFGSIGSRHHEVLSSLGCEVSVVSSRRLVIDNSFIDLNSAMNIVLPEYVVISNNTNQHIETFLKVRKSGFLGPILIEKPLSVIRVDLINSSFDNTYVAYNMRFNPLIKRLKEEILEEKVISVVAYAGQYLPLWHEGQDYRSSYSSMKSKGGGVLRDFSHELDFINWLFGNWKSVSGIGGKFSSLDIDAEDTFSIMLETDLCKSVLLHLNYLDKIPRRSLVINTDLHTYEINFINKSFKKDEDLKMYNYDKNYSYKLQHEAILDSNYNDLCTYSSGNEVLDLISAIEKSSISQPRTWINNEKNM